VLRKRFCLYLLIMFQSIDCVSMATLRASLGLACFIVIVGCGALPGQERGDQWSAYGLESGEGATREAYRSMRRLLRQGSGPDRQQRLREMMQQGRAFLPYLLEDAVSGNHENQRWAMLVLMELRFEDAEPPLLRLLRGGARGDQGMAGLALGRMDVAEAVPSLATLLTEGRNPRARRMAALALGRIGGTAAAQALTRGLLEERQELQQEAMVLGMAMSASPGCLSSLRKLLAGRARTRDPLRRAVVAAIGYQSPEIALPLLLDRAGDEDPRVRMLALEGLARLGRGDDAPSSVRLQGLVLTGRDADVHRRVLAVAATGGESALPYLEAQVRSPDRGVRRAAAAGLLHVGTRRAAVVVRALMERSEDPEVRATALLVHLVLARAFGEAPDLRGEVHAKGEPARRIALIAEVYFRGIAARPWLEKTAVDLEVKDDVRELARELAELLGADPRSARLLCRARLQVMLDELEAAASWNLNASVNRLILRVLELENARARGGGGGAAPGGGATAAQRSRAAAMTAPPPHEEDLRLHLETYPYMDRRWRLEIPPPAGVR
jgi:HEAT repeat protein